MDTDLTSISELKRILESEQNYLRTGRVIDAANLMDEKIAVLSRLQTDLKRYAGGTRDSDLERKVAQLKVIAADNTGYFEAVRNGLSSAIERLANLTADSFVGTYNQAGSKVPFRGSVGRYRKSV